MKSISVCSAPPLRASASSLPGNLHGHRHEVFGAVQLEVIHLHRDGQIGDRIAQHQRVFELAFLIGGGELAELLAGEVALAVIELGGRVSFSVILMRRNLPSSAVLVV